MQPFNILFIINRARYYQALAPINVYDALFACLLACKLTGISPYMELFDLDKTRPSILIVGPGAGTPPGGIASFIRSQLDSPQLREKFRLFCLDNSLNPLLRSTMPLRFVASMILSARLAWLLITRRPSIVHLHSSAGMSFWEKGFMLLLCTVFRRKTVLHMHGSGFDTFYRKSRVKALIRFILNLADTIVVLTEYWQRFYEQITRQKLVIVPNCPALEFFDKNRPRRNGRKLVFVGDVSPSKGIGELLEAVALLRARGLDNPVVIAGGETKAITISRYREQVAARSLGEVTFPGVLTSGEVVELLSGASVFCLPSHIEGLPIAMLEAMAMGLPVVSTPVGGIPDALSEGVNGYLVPVGESITLADRLEQLLHDPPLREKIGRANQEKTLEYYHPQTTSRALADLYHSLLS